MLHYLDCVVSFQWCWQIIGDYDVPAIMLMKGCGYMLIYADIVNNLGEIVGLCWLIITDLSYPSPYDDKH